ncbi:MAG TPA: SIS domain-containing protein [Solirubrobacteraceae bacterium]|jgi:D-sedoheptulose 7-phosphate isomerase|nr:SIS domain-containing protein [Solirubrobacteraceae bacterium]
MSETSALTIVAEPAVGYRENLYFRGVIMQRVRESITVKRRLLADEAVDALARLADEVINSVREGGKLILFGNGGSAADATHLAAEFVGRFAFDRAPMPALSLSDNASSMTAIGNDYAYGLTFARQIQAFGAPGDVAIALSTSGSSTNVLSAVKAARDAGMFTVAFTGSNGVELASLADLPLVIPSPSTARIQEGYMLYAHIMCELVEQELFG